MSGSRGSEEEVDVPATLKSAQEYFEQGRKHARDYPKYGLKETYPEDFAKEPLATAVVEAQNKCLQSFSRLEGFTSTDAVKGVYDQLSTTLKGVYEGWVRGTSTDWNQEAWNKIFTDANQALTAAVSLVEDAKKRDILSEAKRGLEKIQTEGLKKEIQAIKRSAQSFHEQQALTKIRVDAGIQHEFIPSLVENEVKKDFQAKFMFKPAKPFLEEKNTLLPGLGEGEKYYAEFLRNLKIFLETKENEFHSESYKGITYQFLREEKSGEVNGVAIKPNARWWSEKEWRKAVQGLIAAAMLKFGLKKGTPVYVSFGDVKNYNTDGSLEKILYTLQEVKAAGLAANSQGVLEADMRAHLKDLQVQGKCVDLVRKILKIEEEMMLSPQREQRIKENVEEMDKKLEETKFEAKDNITKLYETEDKKAHIDPEFVGSREGERSPAATDARDKHTQVLNKVAEILLEDKDYADTTPKKQSQWITEQIRKIETRVANVEDLKRLIASQATNINTILNENQDLKGVEEAYTGPHRQKLKSLNDQLRVEVEDLTKAVEVWKVALDKWVEAGARPSAIAPEPGSSPPPTIVHPDPAEVMRRRGDLEVLSPRLKEVSDAAAALDRNLSVQVVTATPVPSTPGRRSP